jgi:hypothetical protein
MGRLHETGAGRPLVRGAAYNESGAASRRSQGDVPLAIPGEVHPTKVAHAAIAAIQVNESTG